MGRQLGKRNRQAERERERDRERERQRETERDRQRERDRDRERELSQEEIKPTASLDQGTARNRAAKGSSHGDTDIKLKIESPLMETAGFLLAGLPTRHRANRRERNS